MAESFGDPVDVTDMSDDELRDYVVQLLRENPNLDAGWVEVDVSEGRVTLSGRVGTDAEVQIAEHLLSDTAGVANLSNELVVDESHRGETPVAADTDAARAGAEMDPLGEPPAQHSDTAEHLVEDLSAEAFGTQDMGRAVRDGTAYQPPDQPTADGYESRARFVGGPRATRRASRGARVRPAWRRVARPAPPQRRRRSRPPPWPAAPGRCAR